MNEHEPTVEQLHRQQLASERAAREAASEATSEEEVRVNDRRADKAHYLSEKLEQQERADRGEDGS